MDVGAVFTKDYSFPDTPSTPAFGAAPLVWKAQVEVQFSWAARHIFDKDRKQISTIMKKAQDGGRCLQAPLLHDPMQLEIF